MTEAAPRRRWWRRRRAIAAGVVLLLASYPLSFVPAVWVAARLPIRDGRRLQFIADVYEPVGMLLLAAPRPVRHRAYDLIELGMPEGTTFFRAVDDAIIWCKGSTFTTLHAL